MGQKRLRNANRNSKKKFMEARRKHVESDKFKDDPTLNYFLSRINKVHVSEDAKDMMRRIV